MDNLSLFPAAGREFPVVVACDGIHLTHYQTRSSELVAVKTVYSQEKEMGFKPHFI